MTAGLRGYVQFDKYTYIHTYIYGRDSESYKLAAGTPGSRRHLVEPKEIAGPASRWSWARTTDGRAANGNGYHRAHGGPTGDEGCGSTSWNRTVLARFLTGGAVNGEPADLVRALVPMEDAQASFQILRLSATSRLSHLLRTVPPSITCQAASNYDALVEWALASIIADDGAAAVGLSTPEEVAHDPTVCQNRTYLGHDALRQAHLPIREGGLGLTSSSSIKGAPYIGCHALVLGRVVAASTRGNLPSLLERMSERPMASANIEELKIVATEAKRSQIEDAVDSSWAALAAEEDPQVRGIGTLLVEAGAGGGGGGGEGRERSGRERGGRGGGGFEHREQWEDTLTTQPDRKIELSQTNRGVGGVCEGVVPRVQSKLSRALHAHRGKKLLQDLQTQESAAKKRAMVKFRGAREKGAMAFVECLGFSQEDTMEGPPWRKTLGRSLGSHDATELVGGMCHGNGCRQETTRLHAISCIKTGWSSLTHNRVLHQALARFLRESKVQFVVEDTWPFRQRASEQNGRLNPLRMYITTEAGALFDNHSRLKNKAVLLDITIVNPCAGGEYSTPCRKTLRRRSRAEEKQVSGLVPRYLLPPSSRYVDMW